MGGLRAVGAPVLSRRYAQHGTRRFAAPVLGRALFARVRAAAACAAAPGPAADAAPVRPLAIGAPSFVVGMAAGRSLQRAHPAATMRSRSAAGVVACAKAARSAPLSARRCPLLAHRSAAPAQRGPPYSLRCGRFVGSLSVGNSALSCHLQAATGANLRPLCNSAQQ